VEGDGGGLGENLAGGQDQGGDLGDGVEGGEAGAASRDRGRDSDRKDPARPARASGPAAAVFVVLHGMGNGVLTIAKGTLPLAVFGPVGYGARTGLISAPSRLLQATAPFLFGLVLEGGGVTWALWLTAGCCLAAFVALVLLRAVPQPVAASPK
jgi:hypothetical protein